MKKLLYISIALVGLLMTSCASDKKDDSDTPTPSADTRDRYIANWNVHENSAVAGTNTYTVNITKSTTNSSEIILNNFSDLQASARAIVSNNNLTIPYQQIGTIGFTKGSGIFNGTNSISFTYTTTISTSRDSCSATYTR